MVRIIAELEPSKNREKLISYLNRLVANVDAVDIPEVPMGRPIASAPVLAAHFKAIYGDTEFIPHIRVIDVNRVGLLSILGGLHVANIREAVLLRGDDPVEGVKVEDITVEEAAVLAKQRLRGRSPSLGAMLSIRYPLSMIEQRLNASLDFYMVLRGLHSYEKLVAVSGLAKKYGKKLYAYVIIASDRNRAMLKEMLGDQPVYNVEDVETVVERLAPLVDGVILSSPGDREAIIMAAQRLYRRF